jgi:serine/threonine-protein kinase HSL1 (negative regulator of Swe1 kinase)
MYMAPELFDRGKEYKGTPCDIWACGVVLYAISTGHFPFAANTERDIITKVKRGIYHIPQNYPPKINQILQKMLNIDPSRRATAAEILILLDDIQVPFDQNAFEEGS